MEGSRKPDDYHHHHHHHHRDHHNSRMGSCFTQTYLEYIRRTEHWTNILSTRRWTSSSQASLVMGVKEGKVILVQVVEALTVARGWGSHIFRHSAHRWRHGCQPYAPAAFTPRKIPGTHFC
jgi:hypothetical protein